MDHDPDPHQTSRLSSHGCHVALTRDKLSVAETMDKVRSPAAGAVVLFAGTTRDNVGGKPVKSLAYSAYDSLALRTMLAIASRIRASHRLQAIAMVHRLGTVPIGEESILIAVSAPHRKAAWLAGQEALDECKAKLEVWKRETLDGDEAVWKANRDDCANDHPPS